MDLKAAALILLLLGGCTPSSPEAETSEGPSRAPQAQTTEALPEWDAPDEYSFELRSSCGERSLIGRFHVAVKNDRVRAKALDERARAFMRYEDGFGGVPTITELMEEAETALGEGADVVEVDFDEEEGHPTSIEIDHNEQAIDDEACYVIRDYKS